MEAREIINDINYLSCKLKDLLKQNTQEENDIIIKDVNEKIIQLESEPELNDFVNNIKNIITVLNNNPDDDIKSKSFLNLLSIISKERSRLIEKYTFCSEPE